MSTKQEHLVDEIAKILNGVIRAVLPIWKTTPNETLYRDSGIPTARVVLEQTRLRLSHRILAVDKEHPLVRRAARRPFPLGREATATCSQREPDCNGQRHSYPFSPAQYTPQNSTCQIADPRQGTDRKKRQRRHLKPG